MPLAHEFSRSEYVSNAARTYRKIALEEIPAGHPVTEFNRVYQEIAGPDGVIERSSFDPADHLGLLEWMQLIERTADGRLKCRLMGSGVVRVLKVDFTGWCLDDYLSDEMVAQRIDEFESAAAQGKPQFSMSRIQPESGPEWSVYRGAFPGRRDGVDLFFLLFGRSSERVASTRDIPT